MARRKHRRKDTSLKPILPLVVLCLFIFMAVQVGPNFLITILIIIAIPIALIIVLKWLKRNHRKKQEILRKQQAIELHHNLGDLLALTPTEFEKTVGYLLEILGYKNVLHTGQSGDLTADLTCSGVDGKRIIVQCKRYAPGHSVGSSDIQTFIGMLTVHHNAEIGIFVTTSTFTQPAIQLAQYHKIQLVDGTALISQIKHAQLNIKQAQIT